MFGSAIRIVKNRQEAEDIVQDSFIKGFEKIKQLSNNGNLGAWLKRIVINKSLDFIRAQKKVVFVDETFILETPAIFVEDTIESSISIDFVKECIFKLKEKYKIILILYLIEEYNHREIGKLLNLKESTVRNQYKRGKDQLLELLKTANR